MVAMDTVADAATMAMGAMQAEAMDMAVPLSF